MPLEFKNYDPANTILSFKGTQIVGFMTGTFITATRDTDSFSKAKGALGDTTRVRNRDRSGRVTFSVMRENPINDVLSNYLRLDELFGNGYGTLTLQDINGTTLLEAGNAWLVRQPDWESATEASAVEWMIDCDELVGVLGGAVL